MFNKGDKVRIKPGAVYSEGSIGGSLVSDGTVGVVTKPYGHDPNYVSYFGQVPDEEEGWTEVDFDGMEVMVRTENLEKVAMKKSAVNIGDTVQVLDTTEEPLLAYESGSVVDVIGDSAVVEFSLDREEGPLSMPHQETIPIKHLEVTYHDIGPEPNPLQGPSGMFSGAVKRVISDMDEVEYRRTLEEMKEKSGQVPTQEEVLEKMNPSKPLFQEGMKKRADDGKIVSVTGGYAVYFENNYAVVSTIEEANKILDNWKSGKSAYGMVRKAITDSVGEPIAEGDKVIDIETDEEGSVLDLGDMEAFVEWITGRQEWVPSDALLRAASKKKAYYFEDEIHDEDYEAAEGQDSPVATTPQAPSHFGVQVGDIFYDSWGYDQTNIDFYEVVALVGKSSVKVQQLNQDTRETGFMCGPTTPICGSYQGQPELKRLIEYNGQPTWKSQFGWIRKWDGSPVQCSWYA